MKNLFKSWRKINTVPSNGLNLIRIGYFCGGCSEKTDDLMAVFYRDKTVHDVEDSGFNPNNYMCKKCLSKVCNKLVELSDKMTNDRYAIGDFEIRSGRSQKCMICNSSNNNILWWDGVTCNSCLTNTLDDMIWAEGRPNIINKMDGIVTYKLEEHNN